jgi:hypothetical protein
MLGTGPKRGGFSPAAGQACAAHSLEAALLPVLALSGVHFWHAGCSHSLGVCCTAATLMCLFAPLVLPCCDQLGWHAARRTLLWPLWPCSTLLHAEIYQCAPLRALLGAAERAIGLLRV